MKARKEKYIAFLRGINVGGHHKVPMVELREALNELGLENCITLLNSGNIIFDYKVASIESLEKMISSHLTKRFEFSIPTIIRKAETIDALFSDDPFKNIKISKDIRLYISFLKNNSETELELPWISPDKSFTIIDKKDKNILSVLDLSYSKTPKAMEALEKFFGKDITTRNWKTIARIEKKINASP